MAGNYALTIKFCGLGMWTAVVSENAFLNSALPGIVWWSLEALWPYEGSGAKSITDVISFH